MILTLLAQLPLMPIRQPTDLIRYNQVVLMLGLATYITIGYLVYAQKIPVLVGQYLPANQWLAALVALDLALYVIIHRFQFGLFPVLCAQQLPDGGTPYLVGIDCEHPPTGDGAETSGTSSTQLTSELIDQSGGVATGSNTNQNQTGSFGGPVAGPTSVEDLDQQSSTDMDLTAEQADELSSILKQQGGGQLADDDYALAASDPWTHAELQTALQNTRSGLTDHPLSKNYGSECGYGHEHYTDPTERSVSDGDYFPKSQTVVENWDEEEFSNMEYLEL